MKKLKQDSMGKAIAYSLMCISVAGLISMSLTSCASTTRAELLDVIVQMGSPKDTDTEYVEAKFAGDASLVMIQDQLITFLIADGEKVASLWVYLDEPSMMKVWSIEIGYTDNDERTAVYLNYEFGIAFLGSQITADLDMSVNDFADYLHELRISDIEWILSELHYL